MGRPKQFERNQVLADAIQVFWRQGFKDTSLQDLEKATGVNKSGLYSEFKDKDELFTEGVKLYSQTNVMLAALKREPLGWQNLEDLLLAGSRCEHQKGCFVANSVREVSVLPKAAKAAIETHLNELRARVLENLRAVKIKVPLEHAAEIILTYSAGLGLRYNLGPVEDIDSKVKTLLQLLGRSAKE